MPGAFPLAVMMLIGAVWAVAAALELAAVDIATKAFWTDDILEPTVDVHLLRIIQEALTNARKHAHAKSVRVSIKRIADRARIIDAALAGP